MLLPSPALRPLQSQGVVVWPDLSRPLDLSLTGPQAAPPLLQGLQSPSGLLGPCLTITDSESLGPQVSRPGKARVRAWALPKQNPRAFQRPPLWGPARAAPGRVGLGGLWAQPVPAQLASYQLTVYLLSMVQL